MKKEFPNARSTVQKSSAFGVQSSLKRHEVFAHAKINLTLHVTGQLPDGYHLLDSLVVFADIGDRLWITPQATISIEATGPFAQGVPTDARNLVWQAAELAGVTAHIKLEKNLPHGAGIGGGSSDAAAVLRHFGVSKGAARLGADVPVCLNSTAQRMQGIGDQLTVCEALPDLYAVLVNPNVHVPTPEVFKRLTLKENPAMPESFPAWETSADLIGWLAEGRNDLQSPAIELVPQISQVISEIKTCEGVGLARMSGSGATCFGLFPEQAEAAAAAQTLAQDHPDWWVRACRLS